jgi:hypothetical protein
MISIVYVICEFSERPLMCQGSLHQPLTGGQKFIEQGRGQYIKAVFDHGELIMCLDCGIRDLELRKKV